VLLLAAAAFGLRLARSLPVEALGPFKTGSQRPSLRLDPNAANWPELAALPGFGEVLARRIVTFRDAQPAAPRPVFRSLEDLQEVPGIGPSKAAALAGYLRFGNHGSDR